MLADSAVTSFVATSDADAAQAFYGGVLGLRLRADTPFALAYEVGGRTLRIAKTTDVVVPPYSVLAWEVDDIVTVLDGLVARGVEFLHFGATPQDERGIWTTPDGAKVAWFRDPEGHILSLSQQPRTDLG